MCDFCQFPERNPIPEQLDQLRNQKERMIREQKNRERRRFVSRVRKELKEASFKIVCAKCQKTIALSIVQPNKNKQYCSMSCMVDAFIEGGYTPRPIGRITR